MGSTNELALQGFEPGRSRRAESANYLHHDRRGQR